jgi:hypothetical protein
MGACMPSKDAVHQNPLSAALDSSDPGQTADAWHKHPQPAPASDRVGCTNPIVWRRAVLEFDRLRAR